MTKYTADQVALQAHIEAENARWVQQCQANGATFYTTTVSDPEHWEAYGITTIEQYKRYSLEMSIWDTYKDVHGFRPRHLKLSEMSMEELGKLEDELVREGREQREEEQRAEREEIERIMEAGAPDEDTARRWLDEARWG